MSYFFPAVRPPPARSPRTRRTSGTPGRVPAVPGTWPREHPARAAPGRQAAARCADRRQPVQRVRRPGPRRDGRDRRPAGLVRRDRPVCRRRPGPALARCAQRFRRRHRPGLGKGAARGPGQRRVAVPGHQLRRPGGRHHRRDPQACGSPSPTAFAVFDPATSSWRTSPRSARAASRKSSATWPRSGTTRNGSAFALPTPEPRTAATACSVSAPGPGGTGGARVLPTPVAGNLNDGASIQTWMARWDRQKKPGWLGRLVLDLDLTRIS
jgi:hypothetical protein